MKNKIIAVIVLAAFAVGLHLQAQTTNAPPITGVIAAPLPPTTHTFTIPAAGAATFFALPVGQIGSLDPQLASIPATQTLHAGTIFIMPNGNIRVTVTYQ
jgi:hypothetical protein